MAVEVPIRFTTQGAGDADRQVEALRKRFKSFQNEIKNLQQDLSFQTIPAGVSTELRRMEQGQRNVAALRQEVERLRSELDTPAPNMLDGMEDQIRSARNELSGLQSITSGLAGVRRFTGGAGLGGLNAVIGGGAETAALLRGLPQAASGLANLSSTMLALGGVSVGLSLGMKALKDALSESAEATRAVVQEEKARVEAAQRTREELRSLELEAARQRKQDLEADLQLNIQARDAAIQRLAAEVGTTEGNLDALTTAISGIGQKLGVDLGGNISTAIEEIEAFNAAIAEQETELSRFNTQVLSALEIQRQGQNAAGFFINQQEQLRRETIQNQREIQQLTAEQARQRLEALKLEAAATRQFYETLSQESDRLLDSIEAAWGSVEAERMKAQFEALQVAISPLYGEMERFNREIERTERVLIPAIEAREREEAAIKRLTEVTKERIRLTDQLNSSRVALQELEAQKRRADAVAAEDAALKALHTRQLSAIDARINEARAADRQAQQQAKIVSIQREQADKLTTVNQRFFETELRRLQDYYLRESRLTEDYNRSRLRTIEDLNDELTEAAADNDVVRFIQRQRDGTKELTRSAEDFGIEAKRRAEDLRRASDDARLARQKEIDNLRLYYQERLLVERAGLTQTLSLVDQLQQERQVLVARQQAEIESLRQRREIEAFNARRQGIVDQARQLYIDFRKLDEQTKSNTYAVGRNAAASFVNGLIAGASGRSLSSSVGVRGADGASIRLPTAYAEGGVIDRPTLALMGEKPGWGEVLLPFRKSEGAASALGQAKPSIYVDLRNSQIGVDLSALETRIGNTIVQAFERAG